MRKLAALALVASLMPGCCVVGMTAGAERASSHNDAVARKLERGERLDADDKEACVGGGMLTGFVAGAAIDIVVIAIAASMTPHAGGNLFCADAC